METIYQLYLFTNEFLKYASILFLARWALDFYRSLRPTFEPDKFVMFIAGIIYLLTDWLVKPLARRLKPLRVGKVYFDLTYIVITVGFLLLQKLVNAIFIQLLS